MIMSYFRRSPDRGTIDALYGAIVAQARSLEFYRDYGVPDTVEGRFDMIVLHVSLVMRRLRGETGVQALAQGLFDTFCRDMDHNLREMGVGDLAVPREMRRLGEAFYGRAHAYDRALADGPDTPAQTPAQDALAQVLARNIYAGAAPDGGHRLASYVRAAARALDSQDGAAVARGETRFPEPAATAGVE